MALTHCRSAFVCLPRPAPPSLRPPRALTCRAGRLAATRYLLQEINFFSRAVNDVIDNLGGQHGGGRRSSRSSSSSSSSSGGGGARGATGNEDDEDDGEPAVVVDLRRFAEAVPVAVQRQLLVAIANNKHATHGKQPQ